MAQAFSISKTDGRVTVLHLAGHLDGQAEAQVSENAHQVQAAGGKFLIADLSEVEIITSAGLRALHNVFKMFTPHEEIEAWQKEHADEVFKSPHFKLAGASPQVYYVLNIAGFLQNIPIYPNLQDALNSFN